jgi:apolipoprotein N-acyltransferase
MNKNFRYLWLVIATVLGFFIGGKWNLPLAAWIAPIFALRFFRDSEKAGRNFLLMWVASAIPAIVSWSGATSMSLTSPMAEPLMFFLTTPIGLLPYVVDRIYFRRFGSTFWLTLVFPIAFTAMDFFSSSGSPFGTFGASAYSQRGWTAVMQVVSITGLWGIPFLIGWFASLVNYVWENGFKFTRLALTSTGLLVLILGLGVVRILPAYQPEQTAQVAGFSLPDGRLVEIMRLLQSDEEVGFRQATDTLHAQELEQIRALAQEGADIVVLQEGAGMGYTDQVDKLLAEAAAIAQEQGIYIVLPTFDLGKTPPENVVHIIDPTGKVVLRHVKFGGNQFEGTLKGSGELQTVATPYGKLSAVICWDADFPNAIKQAGEQDVDLLFVPSNDWRGVKDIHAGMAAFRAVENGLTIYRQTGSGVSSVIDPYGRTLQHLDIFKETNVDDFAAIHTFATPIGAVDTLYPIVGDAFGNAMLVTSLGLLAGLFLTRKRQMVHAQAESVSA